MKIRNGFVTNSSSSSFILAFKDKKDGINQITEELINYDSEILGTVLKDFIHATPITPENICDIDSPYYWEISEEIYDEEEYQSFEGEWKKNHPNQKTWEMNRSPEYKALFSKLAKDKGEKFLSKFSETPYIVELEYEDHSQLGSELEHNVLPYCNFVHTVINNH